MSICDERRGGRQIVSFRLYMIENKYAPYGTILMLALKHKTIPIGLGKTPTFRTEIDWDATAKESNVIYNIGEGKK